MSVHYADEVPGFSQNDRLGLTTFISLILHMLVILGIGFSVPVLHSNERDLPTLEITLINTRNDIEPEQAEFLAQSNQDGGSEIDSETIAKNPLPLKPVLETKAAITQVPQPSVTAVNSKPANELEVLSIPQPDSQTIVTRPLPKQQQNSVSPRLPPLLKQQAKLESERKRLSAEISQDWEEYQKRPRRKFLSARTKEDKYAAYMAIWREKVESIGNLNYPEKAKQQQLRGQLVLDVAVLSNGRVERIKIVRPSDHKALDDAAIRIIQLAAPFAPFPEAIREDTDILHITRTWIFQRNNRLSSR